ncbi:MAG: cation diffusion facilitator family transporter [Bacilli bacterium]|nr:cation diffusion facilitator family transporter [Bacilli bacterium]
MKEKKIIIITAVLNALVASLKLILGITFSFSTLIADSIQSFIDFFTDLISMVTNRIGKRRANKTYPFGYGQVYYLSNLLTGVLLFLIGIFIIYQVCTAENKFTPNITVLLMLIVVLALKWIVIELLQRYSKSSKNELMVESYRESMADFISTCVVIVVLLFSFVEEYLPIHINIDMIGSICMAIYVFYTSIKMIISNIQGILINDEHNDEIKEDIMKELEHFKDLRIKNLRIIKISYYYSVYLQIDVDDNIKIKDFLKIEKKIKQRIRSINNLIKFIDVEPL